jgi:hypothetical protein
MIPANITNITTKRMDCPFKCHVCNAAIGWGAIDMLCVPCRTKVFDKNKCSVCAKRFRSQHGWYRPSFSCYYDVSSYCPACLGRLNGEAEAKIQRLIKKYGPKSTWIRGIAVRTEISYDKDYGGSGFHVEANT